jgi:hypothetical protein
MVGSNVGDREQVAEFLDKFLLVRAGVPVRGFGRGLRIECWARQDESEIEAGKQAASDHGSV